MVLLTLNGAGYLGLCHILLNGPGTASSDNCIFFPCLAADVRPTLPFSPLPRATSIFAVHLTATGAYTLLRQSIGDITNQGVELAVLSPLGQPPDDHTLSAEAPGMRVTTFLPHPALRPWVARYLALDADLPDPLEQTVAPSGGPVLVVLLEGTQRAGMLHGTLTPMPPAYLLGHLDRAALNALSGRLRSFMVQFTATGAYSLLSLSVRELTDKFADLGTVAGPDLREWASVLADAPDDRGRAVAADQVLLRRMLASSRRIDSSRPLATASAACELITKADGLIRVETLAAQLYTTPRTLLRHFEEAVGLSVRSATRVSRFLAARRYIDRHPVVPWSQVVFRFGYADQSHLIRDFQRYCGEPPSVFRARQDEARLLTLVGREAGSAEGAPTEEFDA